MKTGTSPSPVGTVDTGLRLVRAASKVATSHERASELREFGVRQAKLELSNRRAREACLPKQFFGEPGWTMMLELYVSGHQGKPLLVTSLCALSGEPQTTALRWIAILERKGLVRRSDSATDKRVRMLSLSDQAMRTLDRYFADRRHHLL